MTTPQKGRIFISYRRTDTSYAAGRIYDRLAAHFGEDAIFMDVEVIEGGLDFVKVLEDAVQSCDVLLALIGRQWLNTKDEGGNRRLDNPEDFVRIEIAAALKRGIRVIPVLIDGIIMPRSTELPDNLKPLARRNALQVNHHSFNSDVHRLIAHTESALKVAEESKILKAQAVKVTQEKAEKEAAEKTAREKAEREAAQKAAREKAEKEAAEKAAREKAEKEAEKAGREKAEREIAEKAARERAAQETVEKAKHERKEQQTGDTKIAQKPESPKIQTPPRNSGSQTIFWVIGIIGIVLFIALSSLDSNSTSSPPVPTRTLTPRPYTPTSVASSKTPKPINSPTEMPTKVESPTVIPTATRYTGSLPTEITDNFGVEMVLVPAGEFIMGSNDVDSYSDVEPAHLVYLDDYYVDKFEVTNAFYIACIDAGVCWRPLDAYGLYSNPQYINYPITYVNSARAEMYCKWRDARLLTEAEWEKAARGADGRTYPWGEEFDCSYANIYDGAIDLCKDSNRSLSSVGAFEKDRSVYGVYDMLGNARELVTDDLIRGGSFSDYLGNVTVYDVDFVRTSEVDDDLGFRCAKDAKP